MEQSGQLGNQGSYDLKFEGAVASVDVSYQAGPVKLTAKAELPAKELAIKGLEWLKGVIPGTIDDKIIDVVEAALAKV